MINNKYFPAHMSILSIRSIKIINFTHKNLFPILVTKQAMKSTREPRCNFTIGVQNDGLFSARFRVYYSVDGIRQTMYQSPSMQVVYRKEFFTIPYYATEIVVDLQVLGFSWFTIWADSGVSSEASCTKCYKTWGAVTNAKWDYVQC